MDASIRSLFAFWIGGAAVDGSAPAVQGGIRSPFAFWIGGAAVNGSTPTVQASIRGLLAPWLGGAGMEPAAEDRRAGLRSLFAFWLGGAATQLDAPVLPSSPGDSVPGGSVMPGGPGSQISQSEWLRRSAPAPTLVDQAVENRSNARDERRRRMHHFHLFLRAKQ